MSRQQPLRRILAALAMAAVLAALAGAPATMAATDKKTQSYWETVFGKQLKLKGMPAVYVDPTDDGIDLATGGQVATPGYADGTDFAILVTELKKPQVNALANKQNGKKTQAIVGNDAKPASGERWVFVGARTAMKLPNKAVPGGVQFNLSLDGDDAAPRYGNGINDPVAGTEVLVIGGQYDGYDPLLTGTTRTAGLAPGTRPEYNNDPARASGYYENGTWVLGTPIADDTRHVRFGFQTISDGKQIFDVLTTTGGVADFPTAGPAIPDDLCFSTSVFPQLDADGTPTEYHVEVVVQTDQPLDPGSFEGFNLRPSANGATGPVSGGWQTFPGTNSAYGNFVAERGPMTITFDSWQVDPAPQVNSQALMGGTTLALDGTHAGLAIGTHRCGLLPSVDGGIPVSTGEQFAGVLGFDDPATVPQFDLRAPDGSDVRLIADPASQQPLGALVAGNMPSSRSDYERRLATSYCGPVDVGLGERGVLAICPNGIQRLFWFQPFEGQDFGRIFTLEVYPNAADATGFEGITSPLGSDFQDLAADFAAAYGENPFTGLE